MKHIIVSLVISILVIQWIQEIKGQWVAMEIYLQPDCTDLYYAELSKSGECYRSVNSNTSYVNTVDVDSWTVSTLFCKSWDCTGDCHKSQYEGNWTKCGAIHNMGKIYPSFPNYSLETGGLFVMFNNGTCPHKETEKVESISYWNFGHCESSCIQNTTQQYCYVPPFLL